MSSAQSWNFAQTLLFRHVLNPCYRIWSINHTLASDDHIWELLTTGQLQWGNDTHTKKNCFHVVLHILYPVSLFPLYAFICHFCLSLIYHLKCTQIYLEQIDLCPICESILPQVQVIVDKASTEVCDIPHDPSRPSSVSCSYQVEVCTLMEILCNQLPYDPEVFAAVSCM